MSQIKHGSTAWRLLVELAGRDEAVELRDLRETLDLEPVAAHRILTDLWSDERVKHAYDRERDGETWYQITWQGHDALRRLDEKPEHASVPKRRWWQRSQA